VSKPAWQFIVASLALLAVALLIGLIAGQPLAFVAVALGLMLLRHAVNLLRFDRWLRSRATRPALHFGGLWGEDVAIVDRLYRRKVYHKRRTLALLREFRRMTTAMPDGAVLLGPNREILWFNRAASRWLDLKRKVDYGLRIDNLVRVPDFVEYLDRDGEGIPPRIRFTKNGELWLSFRLVTTNASGPQLLLVRDVATEARLDSMQRTSSPRVARALTAHVVSGCPAEDTALDLRGRGPVQEMRRQSERMGRTSMICWSSRLEVTGNEADRVPVDVEGMLAPCARRSRVAHARSPRAAPTRCSGLEGPSCIRYSHLDQRREVHARRWAHRRALVDRRARRERRVSRHRYRDRGRASAASDRALLPGRCRAVAQARRVGARSRHRQARTAATRRPARGDERRREGQQLHLQVSGEPHFAT
jgi:two-component system phosphate regulon sensor histidine kinase PhoR